MKVLGAVTKSPATLAATLCLAAAVAVGIWLVAAQKPWDTDLSALAKIRVADCVRVFSWWAALCNIVGLATLGVTAAWWTKPVVAQPVHLPFPRAFVVLVAAAMAVTLLANIPRLGHSLWDDEEYCVRRSILGSYVRNSDDTVRLKEIPWRDTLWA
jgi:hypothetical protein